MIGMSNIVETRLRGLKPAAVFVHLVQTPIAANCFRDPWGVCTVEVGVREAFSGLDFRPLIGLWVVVYDLSGERKRHAELSKLIAKANPDRLQMAIRTDDGWLVHDLCDGVTTSKTFAGKEAESIAKGASRCET